MSNMNPHKLKQPYVMGIPRIWFYLFVKFIVFSAVSCVLWYLSGKAYESSIAIFLPLFFLSVYSSTIALLSYIRMMARSRFVEIIDAGYLPCPVCGYSIEDSRGFTTNSDMQIVCSECGCSTKVAHAHTAWTHILGKSAFRKTK